MYWSSISPRQPTNSRMKQILRSKVRIWRVVPTSSQHVRPLPFLTVHRKLNILQKHMLDSPSACLSVLVRRFGITSTLHENEFGANLTRVISDLCNNVLVHKKNQHI